MSEPTPPTIQDRLLTAFRALVRAEFPQYTYLGIYEYAIRATDGSTVDCDPVDTTIPLPSLAKVPLRSSILGETVTPQAKGERCLVMFVNGDPTRAICVSTDPYPKAAQIGDATTTTLKLAGGVLPAARATDAVVAGPFVGTITAGSSKVSIG